MLKKRKVYIFCKDYFFFLSLIWLLEAYEHLIDILSVSEALGISGIGKSFVNSDF